MTIPYEDRRVEEPLREDVCNSECKGIFILERRVNSHAAELIALKEMIKTNNAQTKEILDIVGLGRAFFKVLGWLGSAIKPIVALCVVIGAVITWVKTGVLK